MSDAAGARRQIDVKSVAALIVLLVLSLLVGGVSGGVTAKNVVSWYPTLHKAAFNPPNWVFGPVWTALYIMMAVAAWRVWRKRDSARIRGALALYGLQLALNFAWSLIFFGAHAIGAALVDIGLLLAAVLATAAAFHRIDRPAPLLMAPYGAWVAFATLLNFAIWRLN